MSEVRTAERREVVLSPWVTLVTRSVVGVGDDVESYHSFKVADYVSVLALTRDDEVLLVRQYRPVLERETLELPGGTLDGGEDPAGAAERELAEETGFAAPGGVTLLGTLDPDTGRLENRLWAFFAKDAIPVPGWQAECGVSPLRMPRAEFRSLVAGGGFSPAMHVALVGLAHLKGLM